MALFNIEDKINLNQILCFLGIFILENTFFVLLIANDINEYILLMIFYSILILIFFILLRIQRIQFSFEVGGIYIKIIAIFIILILQNEFAIIYSQQIPAFLVSIFYFIKGQQLMCFIYIIHSSELFAFQFFTYLFLLLYLSLRMVDPQIYIPLISQLIIFIPMFISTFKLYRNQKLALPKSISSTQGSFFEGKLKLLTIAFQSIEEKILIYDTQFNMIFSSSRDELDPLQVIEIKVSKQQDLKELLLQQLEIIEPGKIKLNNIILNNLKYDLSVQILGFNEEKYFLLEFSKLDERMMLSQAKLSHEIKNPLNAILAMLEILEEEIKDFTQVTYVQSCLHSGKLLLSLLSDLQDMAQLEKNKIRINNVAFKLKRFFKDIIVMFKFQCEKKQIDLYYQLDQQITFVSTDQNRLKQILINLTSNAIKYSKANGRILLSATLIKEDLIRMSVKDDGMGISQKDQQVLFTVFGRNDQTSFMNQQGVGLGLYISQELALLLGPAGNLGIQVNSNLGGGSDFYFMLQNYYQNENLDDSSSINDNETIVMQANFEGMKSYSIYQKSQPPQNSASSLTSKQHLIIKNTLFVVPSMKSESLYASKLFFDFQSEPLVLVVDDDPFNLQAMEGLLKLLSIKADTALGGEIAIRLFQEKLDKQDIYRLIFMDIEMPGMDGMMTSNKIMKMIEPLSNSRPYIVGCTGYSHMKSTKNSDIKEFLEKPITKKKLQTVLKRFSKQ